MIFSHYRDITRGVGGPMEQLRVLSLTSCPPNKCGIATYAKEFYESLRPHGVQTYFATHTHDFFGNPIDYNGTKNIFPVFDPKKPASMKDVFDTVLELSPDVVHIQHEYGLWPSKPLLTMLDKLSGRFPISITYHSAYSKPREEEINFTHEASQIVDASTFHCTYQKRAALPALGKSKAFVIPHGARADIRYDTEECKKNFGYEGNLIVGHASWIAPNKGLHESVRVFSAARDRIRNGKEVKLVIAGGYRDPNHKAYFDELMQLIDESPAKNDIIFLGIEPVEGDDIYRTISSFDAILGLYMHESQSGFDARGYACGKPGVCTDIEGWGAQARESGARIAVKPKGYEERHGAHWAITDEEAAANALVTLMRDEEMRREMAQNARQYRDNVIGWPVVGREIYDMFETIANRN